MELDYESVCSFVDSLPSTKWTDAQTRDLEIEIGRSREGTARWLFNSSICASVTGNRAHGRSLIRKAYAEFARIGDGIASGHPTRSTILRYRRPQTWPIDPIHLRIYGLQRRSRPVSLDFNSSKLTGKLSSSNLPGHSICEKRTPFAPQMFLKN